MSTSYAAPSPQLLNGHWCRLEPLTHAHGAQFWPLIANRDELWQWLPDLPPASADEFTLLVESKLSNTALLFFAIIPQPVACQPTGLPVDQPAGWLALMRPEPAHGVVEVGHVLYSPALQRTAAATEAQALIAQYVFAQLRYRRLEWKCNSLNTPSRHAALRLGFQYEGRFRQHMLVKGQNRDTDWFSLLDSEWPARQQAFARYLAPTNFDANGQQIEPLERN